MRENRSEIMQLDANGMDFSELNKKIKETEAAKITITNCLGQRYVGNGLKDKELLIEGTPGNALGAYLDGGVIRVKGNVQEATGDTMNHGEIYVHGSSGDITGYAMRGGGIFIQGDVGYRAGIHMKAYEDHVPVLVIGGKAGSFLGEYQAGGIIAVLGLGCDDGQIVGNFCGTGMHGGKIFLRTRSISSHISAEVVSRKADNGDWSELKPCLLAFCREFALDIKSFAQEDFWVLEPNTKNPYKKLYVHN